MEVDNSNEGILKTHSRLLARLSQDKREEARRVQWVVEMEAGSKLVQVLEEAGFKWSDQRKGLGKGARMESEKHEVQWKLFIQYVHEANKHYQTKSDHDKRKARRVQNWAELAGADEDNGEPKVSVQLFRMVGRMGRGRQEGTPAIWIVKFRSDTQRARESYEETNRCREELEEICGIKIRRDTGPKDQTERALDAHMQYQFGA